MKNILFLTLSRINNIDDSGIYSDLMREFARKDNRVYIASPIERRFKQKTHLIEYASGGDWHGKVKILKIRTGNIQKTNIIEKGISTLRIESQFTAAIKKYFPDVKFDLVLYSTPPITLCGAVKYIKHRDGAKTYLMLKDIFPQNAVDLGMMSQTGAKGLLYQYFRRKEKKLYALSDRIGCMSQANVDYVLKHNPEIPQNKVEICPNCIEPIDLRVSEGEKTVLRKKYGLPEDKKIFIYGGNLGRPQDVPFIVNCLKACADIEETYFVIAGSGTDRHFIEEYIESEKPGHVKLFGQMPKDEYDKMIACCDVGLIFLDHRFTIPNFPSRLLSYMQAGLPIIACTDTNTDIGRIIVDGKFGWWCESNSVSKFYETVRKTLKSNMNNVGTNAVDYLNERFTVEKAYNHVFDTTEI